MSSRVVRVVCPRLYLLTPWSRVHLEKLTGSAASQEIPRIFGTRRFLTVLTRARHLSLCWTNSIQSPQPPPTSWRSVLILSSHLRLGNHTEHCSISHTQTATVPTSAYCIFDGSTPFVCSQTRDDHLSPGQLQSSNANSSLGITTYLLSKMANTYKLWLQ
jgi:hypothetical protein